MKLSRLIVLASLVLVGVSSCDHSDSQIDEQHPQLYPITASQSEQYRIEVKQQEQAGQKVTASVTALDESLRIASVTFNGSPCTLLSGDDAHASYEFIMPAKPVTLAAVMQKREPEEPEAHSIHTTPDDYYEMEAPESARGGEMVRVSVTVLDETFRIAAVTFNNHPCTYLSDDGQNYCYEFTMPEEEVTLTATLDMDFHPITPQQGEHTTLAILNCHYNYGTPEHIIQAYAGQLVRYNARADIGYTLVQEIRGETGAEIPFHYKPDDPDYGACWRFQMPDEPVTIASSAVEKEDYAQMPFVGSYKGCELYVPETRLESGSIPPMNMELKSNTVFTVHSSDRNAFDFDGCYAYDPATGEFTYDRETCKKTYAMEGTTIEEGVVFVRVRNIVEDKPDNNRYYFTAKSDFAYVCAADEYRTKFLLEIDTNGTKSYFYYTSWTLSRVDVAFNQGSTIASVSDALVSLDGSILFRYTLTTDGGVPNFRYLGKEAGTYTLPGSSGPDLILDGFGGGQVGDTTGAYTIVGGIVTFTAGDTVTKYLIDPIGKTYYEVKSDLAWDGPSSFFGQSDYAFNPSVSSSWIKGDVTILMDQELSGKAKPRYAAIRITVPNMFFGTDFIISDCVPYIYDQTDGRLILSQIVQGKKGSYGQERRDVTLSVSEDKQTLTFVTDYIYATSSPDIYIFSEGLELTPQAQ